MDGEVDMMRDVPRVLVYTPADTFVAELAPADLFGLVSVEEINGEHSLEITTTTVLEKEMRVLTHDHTGKWSEWVVTGVDADHSSGLAPIGTYYCVWSIQHDLSLTKVDTMPGTHTPVSAATALAAALGGTSRWVVGTVTQATYGGASMWYKSGWQALGIVVETWGGEIDATIAVGAGGIVSRSVDLYAPEPRNPVTRRFDWGRDLKGIRRKVDETPMAVRVIPRGKGEETGNGGYGRKITIESVNGGVEWIQNDDVADIFRLPDGNGGWEYPVIIIENGDIEDPQELKDWAEDVIGYYTEPKVTYESDVMQLARAGMDTTGVQLGDATECADRGFAPDGLRISGRVRKRVVNWLDETDVQLTIGHDDKGLSGKFGRLARLTSTVESMNGGSLTTTDYLNALLSRLNGEINATGGYTYLVPGIGNVTYDTAVSDPAEGTEASQVTEMRGGTLRFANTRTSGGDWNYTNVITPDGYLALAATIARLTSGYISNADGSFYVDLDSHVVNIGATPMMGDVQLADALSDARRFATDYLRYESGELTLGLLDSAVRNVITATRQAYRTDAGDIAWYGLDESEDIWKLYIDNAQVNDMLQFGGFAWIARQNGNMTVKWVGD